jgi:eukaryotic-like serine/threonine-protein kinase
VKTDRWRRVEEIFYEALDHPPAERAALVEAACGGDAELREEIESLLAAHAEDTFMQEPAVPTEVADMLLGTAAAREPRRGRLRGSTAADRPGWDQATEAASLPGAEDSHRPQRLGPYAILDELGRGGMGVVYRGRHDETDVVAAVKTIRVPSEALLASLRREIHALSRLRHPDVVRVFDQGVDDGLPWYAMELVEGTSLRSHSLGGALDRLASVLTLVRRLCAPLAFLHGEGIVHLDLKPDNVLVTGAGRPMLVDFGLASLFAGAEGRDALEVAQKGGTLAYMAPEQIRGDPVDARADIYALGCVLYELLTERPPFLGRTADHFVGLHLTATPVPPSELVPGLPPALDALVLSLLAKRPSDRIGHADAVADALARLGAEDVPSPEEPRPRAYLYRAHFAGRESAMAEATSRLARLARGEGGLLLVEGESGVGKTRLALEIARAATQAAARVLTGECPPPTPGVHDTGGGPLEALRRPLQAIADRCRERGRHETDRLLGPRGKLLALYEPALDGLPGQDAYPNPVELGAAASRLRLFSYLAETFAALAAARPFVLILDDLQWADELALGFLAHLLRDGHLERSPMLVVGTYRIEELGDALRDLATSPRAARLRLERLDETAVASVVGDMLALTPAPELLSRFLSEQSEGNPFFVAEYLRAAVEEGLLWRDEHGAWQVAERSDAMAAAEDYERLGLPRSLRSLVERRLDGLPEGAAAAVAAAAVVGRETTFTVLERVSGLDDLARMEAVQDLLRRQVLEEVSQDRLRFTHDKLREVAYGRLAADRRAALNRSAAEALEVLGGGDVPAADLGRHWEEAGERARAMAHYLTGARDVRSRYAHGESIRLYRAYLGLADEPTAESIAARNELANTLRIFGRAGEALAEHERALEDARAIGDRLAESDSLDGLGRVVYLTGRLDDSRALYEQALAIAREVGDAQREAAGLGGMAIIRSTEGAFEEACRLYERALALYRALGDRSGEGITLRNLATALVARGHVDEGSEAYEHALAIAGDLGNRHAEGLALCGLADARHGQGRLEEARTLLERAVAAIREAGDRDFEGLTLGNLAAVHADEGSVEKARLLFAQALEANRAARSPRNVGFVLVDLAALERRTGDLDEAERLLDEAEAMFRELDDRIYMGLCACERGHLELARGRSATEQLEQSRRLAVELGTGPDSRLGRAVAQIERAADAAERGLPLRRGECDEDLPAGLRDRLAEG